MCFTMWSIFSLESYRFEKIKGEKCNPTRRLPGAKSNLKDVINECEQAVDCRGVYVKKCRTNSINIPSNFGLCTEITGIERNQGTEEDCSYYKVPSISFEYDILYSILKICFSE